MTDTAAREAAIERVRVLAEGAMQPHEWGYRDPVVGGFVEDRTPFDLADHVLRLLGGGVEFPDARPEFNPINAINWALEHEPDLRGCSDFLHFWREGNLAEYPDFVAWAAALSPRSADGEKT